MRLNKEEEESERRRGLRAIDVRAGPTIVVFTPKGMVQITPLTRKERTLKATRGEGREKRKERREDKEAQKEQRTKRHRFNPVASHKEEELEPRHGWTPWSHKISLTRIQGTPANGNVIGGAKSRHLKGSDLQKER